MKGHFAEKPLPSSGILPFIRGYVCELNFSCSSTPRESFYNQDLYQLTQLTSETLQTLNQKKTIESISTILKFLNSATQQREMAAKITGKEKIKKELKIFFSNSFLLKAL